MDRPSLAIVIILRVIGVTGLFAIPAIFLPFAWMDAIHDHAGLGSLPDEPIVRYLARSLSAFYAAFGAITLLISTDIARYAAFVRLWAYLFAALGALLLVVDVSVGMPIWWTAIEGPPSIAVGCCVFYLLRRVASHSTVVQ